MKSIAPDNSCAKRSKRSERLFDFDMDDRPVESREAVLNTSDK